MNSYKSLFARGEFRQGSRVSLLAAANNTGGLTIAGKVIIFFFLPLFGGGGPLLAAMLFRIARNTRHMAEDWRGEPARPGVAARPGVMERLETIESQLSVVHHEVLPNGGKSMKDQMNRLDPDYKE